MNLDILEQLSLFKKQKNELQLLCNEKEKHINSLSTPIEKLKEYLELNNLINYTKNNAKKKIRKQIDCIVSEFSCIENDINEYLIYLSFLEKYNKNENDIYYAEEHINYNIQQVSLILSNNNFIEKNGDSNTFKLTEKGIIANKIKEIHPLVFANILIETNYFNEFEYFEIAGLIACFCKISISQENRCEIGNCINNKHYGTLLKVKKYLDHYYNEEIKNEIYTGSEYDYNYDLLGYIKEWCECNDEENCKNIIYRFCNEKIQFIGDFIKIILKINNIVSELEIIAEHFHKIGLQDKLKLIAKNTLKFIATNQSLYI